jgi:23S rRNA (cytosine1962-C5)-methyltransferase
MEKVILKSTSRVIAGHPWIFSNELLESPKKYAPGCLVEVYDKKDVFVAIGYINPSSLIAVRLLTRQRQEINCDFFKKRLIAAIDYRKKRSFDNTSFRAVYSEGDFLPGLIVDKYDKCVVVQILTLGMERLKGIIIEAIDNIMKPSVIVLRNDNHGRTLEGLETEKKIIKGSLDSMPRINEGEVIIEVDPVAGQKTGFFLDQRSNRIALRKYVKGGKGLDLFCYCGAWGLQLAKNNAFVTAVDSSDFSLLMAMKNAALNNLGDKFSFVKDDVFNFLSNEKAKGSVYDFIVLDPPAFVKSKAKIKEALRAYRQINANAMRLIKKGGVIATSSCSYHVDKFDFIEMLRDAAKDAGRVVRLLELRSQGHDHPVLLSVPETEYLKCAFLEVV